MNKKYIKPSIVIEKAQLKTLMETVSIQGQINNGDVNNITINGKGGNVWDDEEDE